jgi:FkbM family methyltransferase
MKIKSVYSFFKWELVKMGRAVQLFFDNIIWRPKATIDVNQLLISSKNKQPFYFIQIGANDGITGDKLHRYIETYKWEGILVEPVPYIFERLKQNYIHNSNLIFENSAIGEVNGNLPFYSISEMNSDGVRHSEILSGHGLDQLGSFDRKTIFKHAGMIPNFESFVQEIMVPTITLSDLFKKHSVKQIDLLQVDTEGYDYEILNNASFDDVMPEILIFEHQHMSRKQYKSLISKFKKNGFHFFINGWDTIAIKRH